MLLTVLALLFGTAQMRAQGVPPGCSGSAIGISLFTSAPDVHIGDTLFYSASVFNGIVGNPTSCDASNIIASITTPDGVVHPLVLRRTYLSHTQSDFYTNVVSYVVRSQDIRPDGTVRATAEDTAIIFQNDTPSMGGANQGVNTEVSLPCINLLVQCIPSVGANGAIVFNGTVTNCGNNTLVGVTVTNYVNGGAFPVFFPTNLLRGQSATFTGSYVPADPCNPSTATLVAVAVDQFTATPQRVVSTNLTTCSAVITRGIKVTKECPTGPTAPGQLLVFTGSVSNTGNITVTNVVVMNNQPAPNTVVFTLASLAQGEVVRFTNSYAAPTNCSVTDTLTATATGSCGVPVSSTATATCPITTTPAITVTEVCPVVPGVSGGSSSYSGVVRNSGNITLNNVTVVSDRPAANTVVFTVASLAPGVSANYSGTFTVPLNVCSVTTAVRATGTDSCSGAAVTNTAAATCPITTAPAIAVTLLCPIIPSTNGGLITYTGTVRNSGNVTLTNIVVTDLQTSPTTVLTVPSLAPGASTNFTATFTAPTNVCSVSSTVNASGSDICSLVVVSNTATATCTLGTNPRLIVTQTCPVNPVSPGGTLTFSGTISNAGSIALTNVVVTNDRTGATPVFTALILIPGASSNFTGSYIVPAGSDCSITSTVTARGNDNCSGSAVTNTASATCAITGTPLIAVTLNCPGTPVATGGSITFSGIVSNPGNVPLVNVTVVNNQASPSTVLTLANLAPGASANFTATFVSPSNACSVASTVTARGSNTCAAVFSTASASATCTLLTTPALVVRQNCPVIPVSAGGLLAYSGSVSNAGNITLTNVVVINSQTGTDVVYTALTLLPRAVSNFTGSYTVPLGTVCSVSSTATATGREICAGTTLTNTATATCILATAPAIVVTLICPDNATAPGGVITYTGTVRNSGNVTLNNVTVVNNQSSPSTVLTLPSLAPGASNSFTATFTTPRDACSVSSSVVARGIDACSSSAVTNSASATCLLVTTPRLVVTQNCPTNAGNVLTYTGSVSNSGNITLTNVVVRSDRSGSNVVFMATTLAPGARVNFTGSYGAPEDACSVASTVTATAADKCTGSNVVATATITCPLPTTSRIVVTQTCPLIQVSPGGTLIYSGTVSNAGNATLTNVVVTSDRTGATNVFSIATLAPRASAPFTGRYTVSTDCCVDTSTLTATGRGCDGTLVRDTATRTCPLLTAPAITVTKVCPAEMWKPLAPGDRLTYSGVVSNSGNIALTNVTIVSTAPTNGIRIFGPVTLAAGESANYTASFIIPMDFCGTDTVTARGVSICTQLPVTGSATTTCPVMTTPGITVRKNCPAQPTPHGGLFVFTGSVSNSGNVTLTNVFVVNDQPAPNTPIIGPITLAPGARTNFTASYTAPLDCCEITDTLTARGRDRCSGTLVAATATQVCPLLTTPRIAVVLRCPATVVPNGGLYEFTGWVTNLGDVALTNVYVVSSKPVTNTVVLGPIELAPGEWEFLSGSFIMAPGFGNVILTASGLSTCGARVAIASANCSGPIRSQGTNAFTPSAGVFSGLFFEASEVQNESSGFFTLNLTAKGAYTASLSSQGKKYSASGKFDSEGKATNTIARTHTNPLLVVWSMDVNEADTITGSVGDGHWAAALTGDRATYNPKHNPAPQAGKYTLIIPGTPGATDSPQGDGFGTANIDANGTVQFVGTLADGAKVTQKVSISKDGHWPVYASLHTGRGSLLGWLVFADRSDDDVSGRLSWIRPAIPAGKLFPAGFAVDSDTIGSRYVAPVGKTNLVLQITNGIVIMNGGDMPAVSTNGITLGLGSKVVSTGTNKLTMTFTLSSGLFKGTLVESGLTGKQSFSGVVFQKANYGSGFCLGTNQSAQVVLQAAP